VAGYGVDTVRQKFTGQERDNESYLDFFQARYFSGIQGRFTSPDPGNAGADPSDPQSWNGYAYVSNNPLSYTDPSGLGIFGDIGSIIGSFFPGLGTLIGWGIGSIADLATGQSISPPGIGIGTDIFGSIAGSVNNGQPWNEQWWVGGGSLNTGSVFGSGSTGGFVFSFADQQDQYLNGRLLLPNGDVAIWGIGGGQGGAVLHSVYQRTGGLARAADKVAGCVADRVGLGSLVGGTMVAAGQPIIATRAKFGGDLFGPSILRGNPPTAGTSPASWLARKTIPGAADWLGKTVTSAGIKNTAKLGGAVGRAIPVIGWGILAYDAVKAGSCIAQ
jgi:RHS repeat-associated protein